MDEIDQKSNTIQPQVNRRHTAAIIGLFGFGVVYDQVVSYCHRHGYDDGYTAVLVVAGVGITLLASVPVVGRRTAERIFWLFAASGTPMILGDIGRFTKNRSEHRRYVNGEGRGYVEVQGKRMAGGRGAISDAWQSRISTG